MDKANEAETLSPGSQQATRAEGGEGRKDERRAGMMEEMQQDKTERERGREGGEGRMRLKRLDLGERR